MLPVHSWTLDNQLHHDFDYFPFQQVMLHDLYELYYVSINNIFLEIFWQWYRREVVNKVYLVVPLVIVLITCSPRPFITIIFIISSWCICSSFPLVYIKLINMTIHVSQNPHFVTTFDWFQGLYCFMEERPLNKIMLFLTLTFLDTLYNLTKFSFKASIRGRSLRSLSLLFSVILELSFMWKLERIWANLFRVIVQEYKWNTQVLITLPVVCPGG